MNVNNPGICDFLINLEDKRVIFPKDIEDVPDIIIYFCDDDSEMRRHSFCRRTAKEVMVSDESKIGSKVQMVKFNEDSSMNLIGDHESAGFIYANI